MWLLTVKAIDSNSATRVPTANKTFYTKHSITSNNYSHGLSQTKPRKETQSMGKLIFSDIAFCVIINIYVNLSIVYMEY